MVSIKCQSQYNALTLAGGSLLEAGGRAGAAWGQAPPAHGPRPLRSRPVPEPRPLRSRPGRERALRAPEAGPGRAGRLKQIHGLHFCRLPGGDGAGGGLEAASAQNFCSSPLFLRSQSYKLIWSKKKNNKENV